MKKFVVEIVVRAEIEISEELLNSVLTDEWRQSFYNLTTPAQVAEHLAFNLAQERPIESLDGFADRKREDVKFDVSWDVESSTEL